MTGCGWGRRAIQPPSGPFLSRDSRRVRHLGPYKSSGCHPSWHPGIWRTIPGARPLVRDRPPGTVEPRCAPASFGRTVRSCPCYPSGGSPRACPERGRGSVETRSVADPIHGRHAIPPREEKALGVPLFWSRVGAPRAMRVDPEGRGAKPLYPHQSRIPCGSLSDEAARAPRRPCPRQPGPAPARGSRLRARTRSRPGAPGCGPHGAAQICGPEVAA